MFLLRLAGLREKTVSGALLIGITLAVVGAAGDMDTALWRVGGM